MRLKAAQSLRDSVTLDANAASTSEPEATQRPMMLRAELFGGVRPE
jgi:hypothetical protein